MRALVALLVACGGVPVAGTPVPPPAAPSAPPALMSDPAEYQIDRVTREAGRAIFERTGIGDPYRTGIPYPIFLALLRAYPQTFGGTTGELARRFGFVARTAEPGNDDLDRREGLPVGMHLTIDPITGVPFVVNACALCHAERVRWAGGEATVMGLGNKHVRIHDYDAAFAAVASHGLSAEKLGRLASAAAAERRIPWPEEFRALLVASTIDALARRARARAELLARTANGPPGGVATIESFAVVLGELTRRSVSYARDVGWAKIPDVIGYAQRTTLSWDGSGEGPIDLLAVEADVAAGVRVEWLERHPFQGASLGAYLRQPALRPAFPGAIDRRLAERGRALFAERCAECHGTYAPDGRVLDYDEQIIPLEDLGTDPARRDAITDDFERAANDRALTRGYTRLRRSGGYVPPILTNVWAHAPYGHAGQWPSLAVLATPPARRPTTFILDLDALYDLTAVGLPWRTTGDGYVHDASRPGFSVLGHSFLSDLGADANAVIEYLKTL
jgi:hypothetical protein